MQYDIQCRPSFSVLEVDLDPGEQIVSEAGAMAWMEGPIRTETSTRGGVLGGLKRAVLAGESLFQNTYTAEGGPARIAFVPGVAGDIVPYDLPEGELFLEKSAYIAGTPGIQCDSKFQGLRGFFSEGLFVLRVTGSGTVFFGGYGDVHQVDVDGSYTIDNGYAVAWEPTLEYRLTRARKIRSFLFSDQLLLSFSGRGRVWVQSRSPISLANWVYPFRPVKSDSD
jgi:uncharacterized protein (TIGR00266 family)